MKNMKLLIGALSALCLLMALVAFFLPTQQGLALSYMVVFLAALQQVPQSLYESASMDGAGAWQLTFIDDGTPWNPLTHDDPDITLPADERPIGGLGLLMVKKMMDEVGYARENDTNVLRLRITVRAKTGSPPR